MYDFVFDNLSFIVCSGRCLNRDLKENMQRTRKNNTHVRAKCSRSAFKKHNFIDRFKEQNILEYFGAGWI